MAHRYNNFDAAYAGWVLWWDALQTQMQGCFDKFQTAKSALNDPVEISEFLQLCGSVEQLWYAVRYLGELWESAPDRSSLYESVYWANKDVPTGDGYELTLIKIIEAYIGADDDHRSAHRLLLDAYQASMYDKPFDQEYHASWIKRFRSWA